MAMPRRPTRQPLHAAGYYRPRRHQPVHFLPPMKVKLEEDIATINKKTPRKKKQPSGAELESATSISSERHAPHNYSESRHGRGGRYKKVVMTLASNLTVGNVADMKFLCKDHIHPPHILDSIRYPRDLIGLLEKQHLLSENSLYFMQTLLYYISRLDLYELVLDFRADKQQEYRDRGVDIKAVYDLRNDPSERTSLVQQVLRFRQDLKPKSRFQRADINGLRNKLNELSTKMHDDVNTLQVTNYNKHRLPHPLGGGGGIGSGKHRLPAISSSASPDVSFGQADNGDDEEDNSTSDDKSNEDVVVKLKLYDRKEEATSPRIEPRTRKRSRISSVRSSIASSVVSLTESVPIVIPNAYEPDEEELTLVVPDIVEPVDEEEPFQYTTPIPPPRSKTLKIADKLIKTTSDGQHSHVDISEARTMFPAEDYGNPTTNLDTQHLSEAIKKLRKRMGINGKVAKNPEHRRAIPQKSKRRLARNNKKERKLLANRHSSRNSKLKTSRKVTEGTDSQLPDVYDKFARHKSPSSGGMHYVNILK